MVWWFHYFLFYTKLILLLQLHDHRDQDTARARTSFACIIFKHLSKLGIDLVYSKRFLGKSFTVNFADQTPNALDNWKKSLASEGLLWYIKSMRRVREESRAPLWIMMPTKGYNKKGCTRGISNVRDDMFFVVTFLCPFSFLVKVVGVPSAVDHTRTIWTRKKKPAPFLGSNYGRWREWE